MAPISSFSLIIGTFSNVGAPPNLVIGDWGSVTTMSATWSTCMVSHKVGERLGGTTKRLGFVVFRVFQQRIMQCDAPEAVSLTQQHGSEHGFADTYCVFQHGLEYWFERARRAADDPQHLRCRGLLFQCLGKVVGALA